MVARHDQKVKRKYRRTLETHYHYGMLILILSSGAKTNQEIRDYCTKYFEKKTAPQINKSLMELNKHKNAKLIEKISIKINKQGRPEKKYSLNFNILTKMMFEKLINEQEYTNKILTNPPCEVFNLVDPKTIIYYEPLLKKYIGNLFEMIKILENYYSNLKDGNTSQDIPINQIVDSMNKSLWINSPFKKPNILQELNINNIFRGFYKFICSGDGLEELMSYLEKYIKKTIKDKLGITVKGFDLPIEAEQNKEIMDLYDFLDLQNDYFMAVCEFYFTNEPLGLFQKGLSNLKLIKED